MRKNKSIIAITVIFSLLFTLLTGLSSSSEPVMAAKKVSTPKISVSAVSGGTGIKVTIKKTKNAEGYCIYLKGPQDGQFTEVKTLEKSGKARRKYTLKNLPGGEYSIKVKAYLKSGTKTVWSKESKVAVITIKGTGSSAGNDLPADVKEYVDKNYSYLLPLYDQGLINFSAEYETKDYITLGSYDMWCYNAKSKYGQDGKKEPMVWEVLEYSPDNKTALVISKYVIKTFEHDPSDTFKKKTTFTWEQSSHRTWLNNNFYKAVFSDKEKALINEVTLDNSSMKNGGKDTKDKIFFLSPSEVQKYYPSEDEEGRSFERGCTDCNNRSEHWALRSPAPGNENNLSYVSYAGKIETYSSVSFYSLGIRPACRITLTDEIISKNNLSISKEHKKVLKNVYVTIGSYTENDKKSALEWQVLEYDENAGKALLISKNILGKYRYDEEYELADWGTCTLHETLNGAFFRETFTDAEKALIIPTKIKTYDSDDTLDNIFILTTDEAADYSEKLHGLTSSYKDGTFGFWWFRDADSEDNIVSSSFEDYYYPNANADYVGIRPVMNIDLKYDKTAAVTRLQIPVYNAVAFKQEKKIVITVNKNPNADGYLIYSKKDTDKDFSETADIKQGSSDPVEYSLSDLEPGTYTFRVITYKKNGEDTIRSEFTETVVELEEPDGLRTHKTEPGNVDATAYVQENYPALYDLYKSGKIGLAGEAKRDTITLGSYELEYGLKKNGEYPKTEKMPLEWEVLEYSADGKKALVISKYIICHRAFDKSKLLWQSSSLRKWLNSDFYDKAFTKEEQAVIRLSNIKHEDFFLTGGKDTQDRIFLLSVNDVYKYFNDGYDMLGRYYGDITDSWWLRVDNRSEDWGSSWDPEDWDEEYWPDAHPTVNEVGVIDKDECGVSYEFIGVRPCFWIDLTDEIVKANDLSMLSGTVPEIEKAYVVLGNSEIETDSKSNTEKVPLEWEILDYDEKNNRVLLINRYIIKNLKYNSQANKTTWADSSVRSFLNGNFLKESFTKAEQAMISQVTLKNESKQGTAEKDTKDKIFVLSSKEFAGYFPVQNYAEEELDEYMAYHNRISVYKGNTAEWVWLRTYNESLKKMSAVSYDGNICYESSVSDDLGVRPALWLKLK